MDKARAFVGPGQIEQFRARLQALLTQLGEEGDIRLETLARPGGEGKVDDDAAPLSEMNQTISSSRNRERTARLHKIQDALDRLREDPEMFGMCEDCEDEIPAPRLELMPWATLCISCQGKSEDGTRDGRRRKLSDYR